MRKLRIHSIRHVSFEGIGRIENWATEKGHHLSSTLIYEGESFPDLNSFDWLVVMGGPMGAYDKDKFPWIAKEIEFIQQVIASGKQVLGICLGIQMIAEALGAEVFKGKPGKEIGWFPVKLTKAGQSSPYFEDFPRVFTPVQWHGDTFDLPEGAERLVEGSVYQNQSFSYGNNVLGLQFHLEFSASCINRLGKGVGIPDLAPGIQSLEEVLSRKDLFLQGELLLQKLLDNMARRAA